MSIELNMTLNVRPGMFNTIPLTEKQEHEAAKLPANNKAFIQNQMANLAKEAIQSLYLPLQSTGARNERELELSRAYIKGGIDALNHLLECSFAAETNPFELNEGN